MYIKQLLIILGAYFAGHLLSAGLGLPVPASVLGLLILFLLLFFRVIAPSDVDDTADFFISHLALFFVPSTVMLATYLHLFSGQVLRILIPLFASIVIGLVSAGWITQMTIRMMALRRVRRRGTPAAAGNSGAGSSPEGGDHE